MVVEDDLHAGGEGEEGRAYFYDDWGVDQVDLDFKTGKSLMLNELVDMSELSNQISCLQCQTWRPFCQRGWPS